MKRMLIILTISLSACGSSGSVKNMAMKDYEPKPDNILVDVRTPEEFSSGHVKGAVNVDFFDENFVTNFEKQFKKTDVIYIHCKSGGRSSKAVQALEEKGFKNLIHLDGGILQWFEAGKPVEK